MCNQIMDPIMLSQPETLSQHETATWTQHRANSSLSNAELSDLYEAYGALVSLRSHSVLRSHHLASDVVQNVFVKLMRHGAAIREARSKLAYIYTVTDRCCMDIIKRWERQRWLANEIGLDDCEFHHPVETQDRLRYLLRQLSPFERLIALGLYDGSSQGELSERLGCSRQTINKRVARIQRLAKALEE